MEVDHEQHNSDEDMPELQSVSNSSDSDLEERRQVMTAVVDDDDEGDVWTDEDHNDNNHIPPLEPTGLRRQRAQDDDQDQDRDRRPPSQRVNAPPPPEDNGTTAAPAQPQDPPPQTQQSPFLMAQLFTVLAQGFRANADVLFRAAAAPAKDNAENAKRIIAGLERVPDGLVRRLERLSDIGHSGPLDDLGAVGGDSGCAICWDRLLDGDGAEFAASGPSAETAADDTPADVAPPEGVIELPCAHVFHAACLVPWFSRRGQTTCPTCRFDLDPKGIIWFGGRKGRGHGPRFFPFDLDVPGGPADGARAEVPEGFQVPVGFEEVDDGNDEIEPMFGFPIGGMPGDSVADDDMPPLEPIAVTPLPPPPASTTTASDTPPTAQETLAAATPVPHPAPAPHGAFTVGLDFVFRTVVPTNGPAGGTTPAGVPNPMSDMMNNLLLRGAVGLNGGRLPINFGAPSLAQLFPNVAVPQNATTATAPQPAQPEQQPQAEPQAQGAPPPPNISPAQSFANFLNSLGVGQNGTGLPFTVDGADFQFAIGTGPPPWAPSVPSHMPSHLHGPTEEPIEEEEWNAPAGPGLTLRQRIERREREAGLRCWDASCGVGPSDDDPFVEVPESARKTISLGCEHTFHPSCLVSAQRASRGWREPGAEDSTVQVACSVCRAEASVTKDEWLAGCILPPD